VRADKFDEGVFELVGETNNKTVGINLKSFSGRSNDEPALGG
jgi:hypothetical protein